MIYLKRDYRNRIGSSDLKSYRICIEESDLFISSTEKLEVEAHERLMLIRAEVEKYIGNNPDFSGAMEPVEPASGAPEIIRSMCAASKKAGTGPMSAVAGAVAEDVGRHLSRLSREVIVENGGDIFVNIDRDRKAAIFAGESPLSMKIGVRLDSSMSPFGICSSSGTVGHSVSYGNADAVVCLSGNTALADAVATAAGNRVIDKNDIEKGLEFALSVDGISGCLIIMGKSMGVLGKIEICKVD